MLQEIESGSRSRNFLFALQGCSALIAAAFLWLAAGMAVAGANAAEAASQGKTVNLFASVRDKKGGIVADLTANDFTLLEDGKSQTLTSFSKAGGQPLMLGLLVDTSPSQSRDLDKERSASGGFFDQIVREDQDKAFVLHFDHEVELLQDLTNSHQKLEQALTELATSAPSSSQDNSQDSGQGMGGRGYGHGSHGGGAQLYDAIYLASNEVMKKPAGRKAMILLSDGVDRGSKESIDSALEAAQRSNTMIYTILLKGEEEDQSSARGNRVGFGVPGMGGGMGRHGGGGGRGYPQESQADAKKILERIASETGGRMFEASKKDSLDQIYGQIEEDLRNQYNLGYTPARDAGSETGFHRIQLTTTKKDDVVQVRAGYYSVPVDRLGSLESR